MAQKNNKSGTKNKKTSTKKRAGGHSESIIYLQPKWYRGATASVASGIAGATFWHKKITDRHKKTTNWHKRQDRTSYHLWVYNTLVVMLIPQSEPLCACRPIRYPANSRQNQKITYPTGTKNMATSVMFCAT